MLILCFNYPIKVCIHRSMAKLCCDPFYMMIVPESVTTLHNTINEEYEIAKFILFILQ
jgi:hypothetical protein